MKHWLNISTATCLVAVRAFVDEVRESGVPVDVWEDRDEDPDFTGLHSGLLICFGNTVALAAVQDDDHEYVDDDEFDDGDRPVNPVARSVEHMYMRTVSFLGQNSQGAERFLAKQQRLQSAPGRRDNQSANGCHPQSRRTHTTWSAIR